MDMGPPSSPASKRIFIVKILVRNNCQKAPRKMIKTAEKKGVVVQQGHVDFVDDEFEKVIQSTMERQHISLC
ncbi:aminoacyltransferase [Streptococcus agalactiae]|nr:aminoacyltransferase [Streptococcus agalactiae]